MLTEIATKDGQRSYTASTAETESVWKMVKYEIITHGVFGVCYCCNFFMTLPFLYELYTEYNTYALSHDEEVGIG